VEQGRTIYQRILTWIINKIGETILKAAFVAVAFILTGKFVVSAFVMLFLVLITDFAKITLATDHISPSKSPETWNIGGYIATSAVLGVAMAAEALLLLFIGWSHFGLASNDGMLYTFCFLTLLYFAVFSILSARQRQRFWKTMPSKALLLALLADVVIGTGLAVIGFPGLAPLPWWQPFVIFGFAMAACLAVNDALKVALIRWLVPAAVAGKRLT
jgi:H+-transporting ATPase